MGKERVCLCFAKGEELTAVNVLLDKVLDGALVGLGHGLLLDGAAAVVEALGLVHCALEGVALPSVFNTNHKSLAQVEHKIYTSPL